MRRLSLFLALSLVWLCSYGRIPDERSLSYYVETAKRNSPLIKDYRNRAALQQIELQRLDAMYRHSRLELDGDWLFVPVISKEGGRTAFKWNAQDGMDCYGYDLGESSGHLHAGVTWTQPLMGSRSYRVAREQAKISCEMADNGIRMEEHELERSVTEQYLLCLLDKIQIEFSDTVASLLERQAGIVRKLAAGGMARQSDLRLILIEQQVNAESRIGSVQSYNAHLMDLNLLCGIADGQNAVLADLCLETEPPRHAGSSLFTEQFRLDSLNTAAALRSFNLRYKPSLDLFVSGGMQTGAFGGWCRHFGCSAGLTFTWTIFDGRQKRYKEHQAQLQKNTIRTYRTHAEYRREMRISQCLSELAGYDERSRSLNQQLAEYEDVLSSYEKEMRAGQISVLDNIMVLRNKIQTERDLQLLRTNRQLVIAAYNYWNW